PAWRRPWLDVYPLEREQKGLPRSRLERKSFPRNAAGGARADGVGFRVILRTSAHGNGTEHRQQRSNRMIRISGTILTAMALLGLAHAYSTATAQDKNDKVTCRIIYVPT